MSVPEGPVKWILSNVPWNWNVPKRLCWYTGHYQPWCRKEHQLVLYIWFEPIVGQIGELVTLRHLVSGGVTQGKEQIRNRREFLWQSFPTCSLLKVLMNNGQWTRWRIHSIRNKFLRLGDSSSEAKENSIQTDPSWEVGSLSQRRSSGLMSVNISVLVLTFPFRSGSWKSFGPSVTCVVQNWPNTATWLRAYWSGGKGKSTLKVLSKV